MSSPLASVLAADPLPDSVGGIVFESLEFDVGDPDVLVDDLLYDGGHVHLVSADPGVGKTNMALHMANHVAGQQRHVVWLDYEMGKKQYRRRLDSIGFPGVLRREFLHYAQYPVDVEKHLDALGQRFPGALVILDSLSKALSFAGKSENDNDEVTSWTRYVVKACKEYDMPIVIVDHVARSANNSIYSRGAGAKLADVDVHWRIHKESEYNRETIGTLRIDQKKDREGFMPFTTWWRIGDGKGGLPIEPTDGPPGDDPNKPEVPAI